MCVQGTLTQTKCQHTKTLENSREKKINVKPEKCKTQHVGVITKDSFLQKMKHSKIRHSFGIQTN